MRISCLMLDKVHEAMQDQNHGVPNLKRSELETACEDFSNVIGYSSMGTVYKGTLSSGVEIVVTSLTVASVKDWPDNLETLFRKKISLELVGPAEPLDWWMRMRIAMGMAYCLENIHQLKPPITRNLLNSSAVNLTEGCASKISDFGLWNEFAVMEMESSPESNIYSFGVILFEMITDRLLYLVHSFSLQQDLGIALFEREATPWKNCGSNFELFHVEQLDKFCEVIKSQPITKANNKRCYCLTCINNQNWR